jgi:YidC/Oxa1 family membrane protein insertase
VVSLAYPEREIGPKQQIERRLRLYLGPKVEERVAAVDARLEPTLVVGYGWVRPITKLFAHLLNWLYAYTVPNYGVAIIVITVLLRLAMYPLTQKSMTSMRRMTAVAPQLKEIQERYRDDPQRQQQELMAVYKRMGINPLTALGSGCLPMLLQMPFMIALYFALQGMIELRHAPFVLWLNDLSAPEDFLTLFGVPIRPLTLAMGGSMFLQTYLQPGTNDPQQQQQRQMMLIMSGVFVVMFYSFPSGLVLYWLVSNLLGIAQQVLVNKVRLNAAQ